MGDERERLTTVVRTQVAQRPPWERAGGHLLEQALRERLATLRVEPSDDLAVGLMAVAMLLAEHTPEWGGDARDALAEVAHVGLCILGDAPNG